MKQYFCYIEYFATGEGLKYAIAAVPAINKKAAKEIFCKKHMCSEHSLTDEAVEYFSIGVEVFDAKNKKQVDNLKKLMKNLFAENTVEHILKANDAGALGEFYFKTYVNYS